jgi:hypothetical protein
MMPNDLQLKNGMRCIQIDKESRSINIIVPEGWRLNAIASDSGQSFDIVAKGTMGSPNVKAFATLVPVRLEAPPTVSEGKQSHD